MLGGGPAVTRSTTFGDSTLLEDELKYRYAANAATRTIAVFTLGKYRCHCLAYCLYRAVFGPCTGPQVLQKSLFKRPLPAIVSPYTGQTPSASRTSQPCSLCHR